MSGTRRRVGCYARISISETLAASIFSSISKRKVNPITGHEDPEGE